MAFLENLISIINSGDYKILNIGFFGKWADIPVSIWLVYWNNVKY
jgi:hypothetical protein